MRERSVRKRVAKVMSTMPKVSACFACSAELCLHFTDWHSGREPLRTRSTSALGRSLSPPQNPPPTVRLHLSLLPPLTTSTMSTPTAPPSTCTLSLKPFRPTFTQTELTSLKQLLSLTRPLLPLETYASKQQKYGITTEWMKDALEYWEKEFDW